MTYKFTSDKPIYLQIAEAIKSEIVSGNIKAGARLKSVREYSAEFKANPNTVQKALSELEDLGLIYTDRTNGKFVADDKLTIIKRKQSAINEKVREFFKEMQSLGLSKSDIVQIVEIEGAKKWAKF